MHRLLLVIVTALAAFPCSWDYPIWIPRSKSADPLYRFIQNDNAGYINGEGKIVIPPNLPAFGNGDSEFRDGLLEISVGDGKYVDASGKPVLDPGLFRGWDFSEGLAVAMRKGEDLWGYIDTTGRFAISPRFSTYPNGSVYSFVDGLAMVEVKGKFGFIDRSGTFHIPPRFLDATSFADGMTRVVVEGPCIYFPEGGCGFANPRYPGVPKTDRGKTARAYPPCKFTYANRSGRIITERRFDYGRDFAEGLAPVQLGKLWGFIDRTGSIAIPPQFEDAEPFSSGLTRILEDGKYGYADKSGRPVIEPQFKEAESFREGLAVVGDGEGRYWYINTRGQRSFRGEFALASPFFKGLAHVQLLPDDAEEFAYIDAKGRVVFRY
jgi:WG containing repeat